MEQAAEAPLPPVPVNNIETREPATGGLSLNAYSARALATAIYPNRGNNVTYAALGLVGEAGEVADKVKKVIRDHDGRFDDPCVKTKLAAEVGDVLWYAAAMADELGYSLEDIAQMNLDKLADRRARNVIKGSGDER